MASEEAKVIEAENSTEVLTAFNRIPYALINAEVSGAAKDTLDELTQICKYYKVYKKGASFTVEGTNGDYVPAKLNYKMAASLINKEARFLFAEPPDITVEPKGDVGKITEDAKNALTVMNDLVKTVLDKNNFEEALIKAAKDCFIGKHLRADIGFGFDGDADRLVVVDEKGEVVHGDALIGVLATHLKRQKLLKNDEIVATVMSNAALDEYLKAHKIKLSRSAVGDKNVLEMMKERGLNFGGEQSGHIVFSDFAKTGDGLVSALQASACLLESGKKASELFGEIKPFPQILVNLPIGKKPPLSEIAGLAELENDLKKLGIRSLFRYSGTENLLRLLLEGKDETAVKTQMKRVQDFFSSALK